VGKIADKFAAKIDYSFLKTREVGKWGNEKMGKWENGEMGKWGNGEMGKWENGEMRKWGNLILKN